MKSAPKTKAGKMKKVSKVMKEFKTGSLHSGKGGDPGEWSARKAQLLAMQYKKAGGGYK